MERGVQSAVVLLQEAQKHSDDDLIRACREGEEYAFEELVRRYKDRVYNVVYRYLGNHEDSLDVALEVFVKAYRNLDSFQGHAQVYTWLYSIATNTARNKLRDQSRKGRDKGVSYEALQEKAPFVAQAATTDSVTPRHLAQKRELSDGLKACLEDLPDSFRLPFVLRTFDQLSYSDIAASVGCPQGTVKSRLNQARKRLRDCLTNRGVL
jgi:RNA polymerase sigma-70 factor, ECF subfamily